MIFLDGIIYNLQKHGGISVYFNTLLGELDKLNFVYTLISHGQPDKGPHVEFRPRRMLERYRSVKTPRNAKVFMSSYYRQPTDSGVPVVTTVHDFVYEAVLSGPRVWVHRAQKFAAIRNSSDIICVSEATRQDLYRFFGHPKGRVHVIHNGVSEEFHPLGKASHDGFILFIGNRHGYKNFDLLLGALPGLPRLDLVCVGGETWTEQEKNTVRDVLKGELRIERGVSVARINALYNAAVCLVYPSLYEGFGIPVLEAMRAGCPVVSANCTAVKEAGGSALLVAQTNAPEEVAEQIKRCLSSERASLISAGVAQAKKFSWEKTHAATVAVLSRHL